MFVGHAVIAFTLGALGAMALGHGRKTALRFGVVAGLFATVPDVDIIYALVGLTAGGGPLTLADSFWRVSTLVHRGITHSLLIGIPAAVAFGLVGRNHVLAVGLLAALIVVAAAMSGFLAAFVLTVFALGGILVAVAASELGLSARTTGGLAALGLLSHPFGDIFTGTPPAFLYPLDVPVLTSRIAPFADPTLNLLVAFGVELAIIWAGISVVAFITDQSIWSNIDRRAGFGVTYGFAAVALTPPTMTASYHFVFSVLALGLVGFVPERRQRRDLAWWPTILTGLTAITIGAVTYTVIYLLGP